MCANDLSVGSHWSHFCRLRPKPIDAFMTGTLCHITPSDSGTRPNILLLNVLTSAPYGPVISLAGIRVVMTPPGRRTYCRHSDTSRVEPVTTENRLPDQGARGRAGPARPRPRRRGAPPPARWARSSEQQLTPGGRLGAFVDRSHANSASALALSRCRL